MYKVGITGGIGSGKSTIVRFFELKGIPVFIADTEANILVNTSMKIRKKLTRLLGNDIYLPDQTLDRKKLAEYIFNNQDLMERVNSIVHPEVRKQFGKWVNKQTSPYIIYEAAILFETGYYKSVDYTILVTAPEEMRIARVMKRDNVSQEKIQERIANQWTDEKKAELADYVIKNDNSELLLPQLNNLHERMLARLAKQ